MRKKSDRGQNFHLNLLLRTIIDLDSNQIIFFRALLDSASIKAAEAYSKLVTYYNRENHNRDVYNREFITENVYYNRERL